MKYVIIALLLISCRMHRTQTERRYKWEKMNKEYWGAVHKGKRFTRQGNEDSAVYYMLLAELIKMKYELKKDSIK